MNKAEWLDVKGFEGLYKISSTGRIYSCPRNGTKGGFLKVKKNKDGYYEATLYKNNKKYFKRVHRLVAENFIANPEGWLEVNHKDNDRTNNCVENLEWCTAQYNQRYSHLQNRQLINATPIIAIDKKENTKRFFYSQREASKELGITQSTISRCIRDGQRNERWEFYYDD